MENPPFVNVFPTSIERGGFPLLSWITGVFFQTQPPDMMEFKLLTNFRQIGRFVESILAIEHLEKTASWDA